jgi:hypothetical protein
MLDANLGQTTIGGPCRSLCRIPNRPPYIRSLHPVRLRCCRLGGVASEAQVCDMWAPAQNSSSRVDLPSGDSMSEIIVSRPEEETQLPQRAFISRGASNWPGRHWQSSAWKDRASQGNMAGMRCA